MRPIRMSYIYYIYSLHATLRLYRNMWLFIKLHMIMEKISENAKPYNWYDVVLKYKSVAR